jgi:hypothetical protein
MGGTVLNSSREGSVSMRAWLRVGLVVAALGSAGGANGQDVLTQRDGQGAVTVAVTLAGLPEVGLPIRVTVVLDTHTVALDDVVFERTVALRTPEGAEVAPTRVEGSRGSGHHREAVVVFPPVTQRGTVRIVVRNVGGIGERVFVWERPAVQ